MNDDLTPSGSEDEGNPRFSDKVKDDLVKSLYKRDITDEQRAELDKMVNDMKYNDLKR